ncbi:MAG TPA: phosphatase PAP2 family protein [Sphingomicrobium sp.]|nr:phosphatase PAP2 family protein [Sphingomicrobium sp.]
MGRDQDWLYPAIAIAMGTVICAAALQYMTGYPSLPRGRVSLTAALVIIALTALFRFLRYLLSLWRAGEQHPSARIRKQFRPALLAFWPIAAGVVTLGTFLHAISFLKSMIPAVVPFWADALFAATDRFIFVDPQAIAIALQPALTGIGLFYGLWHAAHLGGILWVLHWRDGRKARHILSFMLTWSIGMFFAFAFSSMGPIFTGQYDPSVAPETTRKAAAFLWANYQADGALLGGGISAFPSMHVAIAAWLAIVLKDRGLPWLGFAYLVGVFAGSVILGWHYVIDSVAGIAIALAADRLALQWTNRAAQQEQAAALPMPAPN